LDPFTALIGMFTSNGADAAANCVGSACNGGNAGLFFGSGAAAPTAAPVGWLG
jgi:hypothetical protein